MSSSEPAVDPSYWDPVLFDGWENDVTMFDLPTAPIEPSMEPSFAYQAQTMDPLIGYQAQEYGFQEPILPFEPASSAIGLASLPTSDYIPTDAVLPPVEFQIDPALLSMGEYAPTYQAPPEIDDVVGNYSMQDVADFTGYDLTNEYDFGQGFEATTAMPVVQAVETPARYFNNETQFQFPDLLEPTTHMDLPLRPVPVPVDSTELTGTNEKATCTGIISTVDDARNVIKCCLTGSMPLFHGRLKKEARASLIKDGNIFCFRESEAKESKFMRWTDGVVWSPNRDIPHFSLYRELNDKPGEDKFVKPKNNRATSEVENPLYVGVLTGGCFNFRQNGLMKKVFKAKVAEETYRVVSYYRPHTADMLFAPYPNLFSQDELAEIQSTGGKQPDKKGNKGKGKAKDTAIRKQSKAASLRTKLSPEFFGKIEEYKEKKDKKGMEDFMRTSRGGMISGNPKRRGLVPGQRALSHQRYCLNDCGTALEKDGSCKTCGSW